MGSWFSPAGLARISARRPWAVVGLWIGMLALAGLIAATSLGDVLTTEITFTNEQESLAGFDLLDERMESSQAIGETVVLQSDSLTVDDPAFAAAVAQVAANLRAMPEFVAGLVTFAEAEAAGAPEAAGLVSADRHATLIPVTLVGSLDEATAHYDAYQEAIHAGESVDVRVLTVGDISLDETFNTIAERDLQTAELFGLPMALLILVVVFGALVAAGLPVALALISIGVSVGLTAVVGQVFELSFFVVNMITMIGLAVGIDYALFVVERYREERRHGVEKARAIELAGATASKAVLFSGITVVLALTGMFLIPTTIFRSLGTGAILAVLVAVTATLTLIPAMLSLLGDRIDWPRRRRYDATTAAQAGTLDHEAIHRGFWGRVTRVVMGRPVIAATLAVLLLGAMAIPYFGIERGTAGASTLPPSEVKDAFTILNRDFSAGRLAPVTFAIDGEQSSPELQAGIDRLVAALNADPSVEAGSAVVAWNATGDTAKLTANLAMDPGDEAAYTEIARLRSDVVPAAFAGVPGEVYVTGETAFNADFFTIVDDWTPIVFAFVLALSFVLLLLVFRSVVIPAKAIVLNLLSVGAAYGMMVLVFQNGVGAELLGFQQTPTIEAWVPIFLFCVLFGLSMDYHVFLLSRIKERYDQTGRNDEAVAYGLQATGRIITGAALIMVVVFTGFAMGDLVMFQQMGFGLAVAVALDATVVRSVLVPAGMAILGKWNWYLPAWLAWLPELGIEGPPRESAPVVATPGFAEGPAD